MNPSSSIDQVDTLLSELNNIESFSNHFFDQFTFSLLNDSPVSTFTQEVALREYEELLQLIGSLETNLQSSLLLHLTKFDSSIPNAYQVSSVGSQSISSYLQVQNQNFSHSCNDLDAKKAKILSAAKAAHKRLSQALSKP